MSNRSGIYGSSYVKSGKEIVDAGSNSLLFGRVINIKFIRRKPDRNGSRTFCIRSDYEPVFREGGTGGYVSFVQCTQKPRISLKYEQVSNDVVIKVELRVESLFIDREIAGEEIDSYSGNPVEWALIQVGYIDQFPRWDRVTSNDDLDRFYDLNNNVIAEKGRSLGGKEILVQVLNATPDGNPPDRAWVFNGVVGTLEAGLRWDHTAADLTANYGDKNFPAKLSQMEALLYQWITRRFIKSSVEHFVSSKDVTLSNGEKQKIRDITVYGYKNYFGSTDDREWTTLELAPYGLLSFKDANALGVTCAVSEKLRSMKLKDLFLFGSTGATAEITTVDTAPFDEPFDGVGPQLRAIKAHYPFLRWYVLSDGTFYMYHVNEKTGDLFKDPHIRDKQLKGVQLLPAVYDITMSGERIIRAPFTNFVDPMTTVLFQSRYRLLDTTGVYYQPKRGMDAFLVILMSVSFATFGDDNLMVLKCVDIPEDQAPEYNPDTGVVTVEKVGKSEQDYTTAVATQQEERNKKWAKVSLAAGKFPFDKTSARWIDIAQNFLLKNVKVADWEGKPPTLERALEDLKKWNSPPDNPEGVWTDANMTNIEGSSPENKRVPGLSFQIPWLYKGDKIKYRQPYKPSYEDSYKAEKEIVVNE